jgi:hypothetical protein
MMILYYIDFTYDSDVTPSVSIFYISFYLLATRSQQKRSFSDRFQDRFFFYIWAKTSGRDCLTFAAFRTDGPTPPHQRNLPTTPVLRPPICPSSRLRPARPRARKLYHPTRRRRLRFETPQNPAEKTHLLHAGTPSLSLPMAPPLTQLFASILSIHPPMRRRRRNSTHRLPAPPHRTASITPRSWATAISPRLQPPARLASLSHSLTPNTQLSHPDPRGRASG